MPSCTSKRERDTHVRAVQVSEIPVDFLEPPTSSIRRLCVSLESSKSEEVAERLEARIILSMNLERALETLARSSYRTARSAKDGLLSFERGNFHR
jgi:hypothetical protein